MISKKIKGALGGLALGLSFGFVCRVTYDTLAVQSPNIHMEDGQVWGYAGASGYTVIRYDRAFTVDKTRDGTVLRKVTCSVPNRTIEWDAPPIAREFQAGYYPPHSRYLEMPMGVPVGTPCVLYTYGKWRPRFAISDHIHLLDQLHFTVEEGPPK